MLEGLEAVEILKSTLERTTRIDSEFYKKENLFIDNTLKRQKTSFVSELTKVSDGNHMAVSENFQESGIPYYRGQDIHHYFIEQSNPICIDEETFNSPNMRRSHLQKGDVLLSIVGTIGGVSLVSADKKQTCNCKLAILRPKNIDGFYLSAFLKSKYGQNQVKKFTRGAVQMGLILEDMSQIAVPLLSDNFQLTVRSAIEKGQLKLEQSKTTYTTAETLLLSEIGLTDFTPSNDPVNIKTFKESFATSGRLDAEYYSMQSESVIRAITQCKYGAVPLHKVCKTQRGNLIPDTYYCDTGTKYIRGADFSANHLTDTGVSIHASFQKRNEILTERGDIVFALIGSVGKLALVTEGFVGSFISNNIGLMRLVCKNFLPEYVHLFLTSTLGKILFDKVEMRTAQPKISDKDIWDFPIPDLDIRHQQNIAALITQSFTLKKQSEHLLEVAKRAVEIAIEQDEAAAMAWIAAHG